MATRAVSKSFAVTFSDFADLAVQLNYPVKAAPGQSLRQEVSVNLENKGSVAAKFTLSQNAHKFPFFTYEKGFNLQCTSKQWNRDYLILSADYKYCYCAMQEEAISTMLSDYL